MPIAKVKMPDGRIGRFQVPDGTTPEQVMEYARNMQGGNVSSQSGASGSWEEASPLQKEIDALNPLERVLVGMGKGFTDVGQGIKQMSLGVGEKIGVVPEGTAREYTNRIAAEEKEYDQPLLDQSLAAKGGRFVGQMAATLPVTLPFGGPSASVGGKVLQGAGMGAASAGVMPTKEGESRLKNAVVGGVVGGGTAGVLGGLGKGYRAIRGDKSAGLAQELSRASTKFEVPLTVGELRGSPQIQRAEQLLERVPLVGTAGFRERQAQSLERAARSLASRYAKEGTEDVGEGLQESLARTLSQNKQVASDLYDAVGEAAAKTGKPVPLNNVKAAVASLTQQEGSLPTVIQDSKILQSLQKYGELDEMSFDVARKVRSRLGQELRQSEKQALSGAVSDEQVAAMKMLRSALDDDMAEFAAREGGELGELFRNANAFYKTSVVPFKDRAIRKTGQQDFDTDQILRMFVKNDRPKLAEKLMGKLDPDGKALVKYAVLQDAFETATGGANKTAFSSAKFAGKLEKLGKSKMAIFTPEERTQLDGFVKLARAAERAGQYAENPPTGMRWIDASILGGGIAGAVAEPATAATAASGALILSRMLTTSFGRRVLTRAAGLPEKSKAFERLVQKELPRALALGAEQKEERPRQQKR